MLSRAGAIKLTFRKKKGRKCEQQTVQPNHCKCRLAMRSEEGDRPLIPVRCHLYILHSSGEVGSQICTGDWGADGRRASGCVSSAEGLPGMSEQPRAHGEGFYWNVRGFEDSLPCKGRG